MKPKHKTLGPIACEAKNSKFKLRKRMPGWGPDEIDHTTTGSKEEDENDPAPTNKGPECVFPEEALFGKKKKMVPFQPVLDGKIDTAKGWVLGQEFVNSGNPFDNRLAKLLTWIKDYNVALYDLRWHHLEEDGNSTNLDPICGHAKTPTDAEKNWTKAVQNLRNYLITGDGQNMILDVVEVNKYVVSVRVVETDPGGNPMLFDTKKIMELGGSSSSHLFVPFKG